MAYTSQYPPAQNGTYVKSTTDYNGVNYLPYFATDPAKSLTGTWADNCFITVTGATTNQRFHIDLGEAKYIRHIYYENGHYMGSYTTSGAKNFTFWGSNSATAFGTLTYATDTDWTQLTIDDSQFDQHAGSDASDPKYVTVTNAVLYRYYAFKIVDNWGDTNYIAIRRIVLQTEDGWSPAPPITVNQLKNYRNHRLSFGEP